MPERCGRDPEVVRADPDPVSCELGSDLGVDPGDRRCHRDWPKARQDVLDARPSPSPLRAVLPVNTVKKLADRYDADRALLVGQQVVDRSRPCISLTVDE
jgi:hypothetical protein